MSELTQEHTIEVTGNTLTIEEIVQLANDQFTVPNATETISAVTDLGDVFAPPHHGPRNVPILALLKPNGSATAFTHFPIVDPGVYYIFLTGSSSDVKVTNMNYNGVPQTGPAYPKIEVEPVYPPNGLGNSFQQCFRTTNPVVFNSDDPQPIAVTFELLQELSNLEYIVVKG